MAGMKYQNYTQKCIYRQKYSKHYKRRIFQVLFVQGIFSKPFVNFGVTIVGSINTTNIKVCVFRGLSRDHIKL